MATPRSTPLFTSLLAPSPDADVDALLGIAAPDRTPTEQQKDELRKLLQPQMRMSVISDAPTMVDRFGFSQTVRALSEIILSDATETPLAIALDGAWGSGKSSILEMIERDARSLKYYVIKLNAWALESAEQLVAEVAAEIQNELRPEGRSLRTQIGVFVGNVLAQLVPASLGGQTVRSLLGTSVAQATTKADAEEIASLVRARTSFADLVNALLQQDAPRSKSVPAAASRRRLLIMIDDLDRALPDQIATMLRNLKLLLETKGCIFLLAMDVNLVGNGIEDHYRARYAAGAGAAAEESSIRPGFGRNYLEKLVQIILPVPRLTREPALQCVRGLGFAEEVVEIVRWAPSREILNPRRLKRYLNSLNVALQLVMVSRVPEEFDNAYALRAIALRGDWPRFYRKLIAEPDTAARAMWPEAADDLHLAKEFRAYVGSLRIESLALARFDKFMTDSRILASREDDLPGAGAYLDSLERTVTVLRHHQQTDRFLVRSLTKAIARSEIDDVRTRFASRIRASEVTGSPDPAYPNQLISLTINGGSDAGQPFEGTMLDMPVNAIIEPGGQCETVYEMQIWIAANKEPNTHQPTRLTRRSRLTIANALNRSLVTRIRRRGDSTYEPVAIGPGQSVVVCDVADALPGEDVYDFRLESLRPIRLDFLTPAGGEP